MADQHVKRPITFRPGVQDRDWLADYAKLHGMSERSVLARALASYRLKDQAAWDAGELLDVLAVVVEALDIPYAACVGDKEIRQPILDQRLMILIGSLKLLLERGPGEPVSARWTCDYVREQLAKHPAEGYRTDYAEVLADLKGAQDAMGWDLAKPAMGNGGDQ